MTYYDDKAAAIIALTQAVEAIEMELGILPAGAYATVRSRLDILEARINNPLAPAPNALNPFFIGNTGVSIQTSFGDPNLLNVLAIPGSLYLREDGYNDQGLYAFRPDGYWHQIDTDPWTAACDLAGSIYCQTVVGIQGHPVNPAAPQTDAEGDGYVLTWNRTLDWWEPQIGFFAAGDLSGNKIHQTVIGIQGNSVSSTAPQDGYALTWNAGADQWQPQRLAVVFSVLDSGTDTNIKTNRFTTQSSIDHTKVGSINLSSDSSQSTTGLSGNYSAILSGNTNQVTGDYSLVVGGLSNTISNVTGSSAVVVGFSNTVNQAQYSFIGSGTANSVAGLLTTILGGQSNTISSTTLSSSTASAIVNGQLNTIANSQFAAILSGYGNSITGSYNVVLSGTSNSVAGVNNVVLNGVGNTFQSTSYQSAVLGSGNTLTDGYDLVVGYGNMIAYDTNRCVVVSGSYNNVNSGSHYSGIWGGGNTTADGYLSIFGISNVVNTGSTFANVHGQSNNISSPYIGIWGSTNTVGTGDGYSTIFGYNNVVGNNSSYFSIWGQNNLINSNSPNTYVWGTSNTVSATAPNSTVIGNSNSVISNSSFGLTWGQHNQVSGDYVSGWGLLNTVTQATNGFSSAWGSSNTVTGDWNNAWGNLNTILGGHSGAWGSNNTVDGYWSNVFGEFNSVVNGVSNANVFGYYGLARVNGQFVQASNYASATAGAGSEQYSRIILDGTAAGGLSFTLNVSSTSSPLSFPASENGKCYDMTIRILMTTAPPTGFQGCAQFVFDVLAHVESGSLVLDNVNTTLNTPNATGWSVVLSTSGNQLVVTVPSQGTFSRRAVATVEWRELSRL